MRKHLVIGAIAAVVIGIGAYVVSQPKEGTVEWHKREYVRAGRQPLRIHAKNFWHHVRGKPDRWSSSELMSYADREKHQRALVKLGYLVEREFVVSNGTTDAVIYDAGQLLQKDPRWRNVGEEFVDVDNRGSNIVIVVARPEDMTVIGEAIHKADVPESGRR